MCLVWTSWIRNDWTIGLTAVNRQFQQKAAGGASPLLSRESKRIEVEAHRGLGAQLQLTEPGTGSSHKPAKTQSLFKKFKFLLHRRNTRESTNVDVIEALPECDFVAACKMLHSKLQDLNEDLNGRLNIAEALKAVQALLNKREVYISVFGQRNCGKSTLTNALLGDNFLPIRYMSETSVRTRIGHDPSKHLGYCPGKRCTVKGVNCPRLEVKQGTKKEDHFGSIEIRMKLELINSEVRRKMKESSCELTLMTWCPILAENVPQGWTVYLVDTPGIGEAKEHIEQLASEALEASAAYIYLLQPDGIEGKEVEDILTSLISKDATAIQNGRIIFAISKLDARYLSDVQDAYSDTAEIDTDTEPEAEFEDKHKHKSQKSLTESENYSKIEAETKEALHTRVLEAIDHDLQVDQILALCGRWAFIGQQLNSILPNRDNYPKVFNERLKNACKCLSEHPNRQDISIPGAQGTLEEDSIAQLSPEVVVEHLNQVTGLNELRSRIKMMVSRCVELWSSKVYRECSELARRVKDFLTKEELLRLRRHVDGTSEELKNAKQSYRKIMSQHDVVMQSVTVQEKSEVWKDFGEGYDKDVLESKVSEEGKQLVDQKVEDFKIECGDKIRKRRNQPYGEKQFEKDIEKLLKRTERDLEHCFDRACSFENVYNELATHNIKMGVAVGRIEQLAFKLCEELSLTDIESRTCAEKQDIVFKRSTTAPNLGDIKEQVEIPPVRLTFWDKVTKWISSVFNVFSKKNKSEEDSYKQFDQELEKALEEAKKRMQDKCESYFKEIKTETIKHFYQRYCDEVKFHLMEFHERLKPMIDTRIKELEDALAAHMLEINEYEDALETLKHLETILSQAYTQYKMYWPEKPLGIC